MSNRTSVVSIRLLIAIAGLSALSIASCKGNGEANSAASGDSEPAAPILLTDSVRHESVLGRAESHPEPAIPRAAHPEEQAVLDAVNGVYAVISGPRGQGRDWDKMRSMFVDGARLIPIIKSAQTGEDRALVWSLDEYITRSGPALMTNGFTEKSIFNKADIYGNIAQVFSTYEGYVDGQTEPFVRGINSFQLAKEGGRWKVVTIFWQAESPELPIPAEFLP